MLSVRGADQGIRAAVSLILLGVALGVSGSPSASPDAIAADEIVADEIVADEIVADEIVAQAGGVALLLSPSSATVAPGEVVQLAIVMTLGTERADTIDAY